jgi:hypothetical protein
MANNKRRTHPMSSGGPSVLSCVDAGTLELSLYKLVTAGLKTFNSLIFIFNNKTPTFTEFVN